MHDDLSEFRISKRAKEKLKNKKLLKKLLAEGYTAQEILGFKDEALAKFCEAGYRLFENRRYKDAANAFLFLVTLNPHQNDYWIGLGMSAQMLGDFESAINAYEMAAICDIENPIPYFYLAKCLFAIHDRDSALQAFDLAIEYAADITEFQDIKEKAIEAKKLLLKADH